MHKTTEEVTAFFTALQKQSFKTTSSCEMWIAPTYLALKDSLHLSQGMGIQITAQNCHQKTSGAFTGELSAEMLQDISIQNTLLGHSERRQYFNENTEDLKEKIKHCNGLKVKYIFCIGENLQTRESGKALPELKAQLNALDQDGLDTNLLTIAYEPVWAIGTGKAATSAEAQSAHAFIRAELAQKFGEEKSQKVRILYGGSVKETNIADFIEQKDIDGALVGGASLDPNSFFTLYKLCCS